MKIIILNNLPIETGIGRYVYNLYLALKDDGARVMNFPNSYDYESKNFVGEIYEPKFRNRLINATFLKFGHRNASKEIMGFDGIVHYAAHSIQTLKSNATKIGTVHDFFPLEYRQIGEKLDTYTVYMQRNLKRILQLDNVIVTTNINKRKLLEEYGYNGNVFVVPYSFSKEFVRLPNKVKLREELKLPKNKVLILSVSSNSPHKNLSILPEVMRFLGDRYTLVRVGEKIGDSITFNYADSSTINKIYNACDILVFPSLEEGFGFPLIEAFATGLPVVVSDIPVFHEIGEDVPLYVDNGNPESIANGVREACRNSEELSKRGSERSKIYDLSTLRKNMMEVYCKILERSA